MKKWSVYVLSFLFMISLTACSGGHRMGKPLKNNPHLKWAANIETNQAVQEEVVSDSLELVESNYAVKRGSDAFYIQYAFIVKNPNTEKGIKFLTTRITAKNANDEILGTTDIVGKEIRPDSMWYSASQAFRTDEEPAAVDFEIIQPGDSDWVPQKYLEYPGEELLVENTAKRSDKIVGEISNPNDYEINGAAVTVLFRDDTGKLLAGETAYVKNITANGKIPFEVSLFGREDETYVTENFEAHASPWY